MAYVELCNCGKLARYMLNDKHSCNKYQQCPTYDEILQAKNEAEQKINIALQKLNEFKNIENEAVKAYRFIINTLSKQEYKEVLFKIRDNDIHKSLIANDIEYILTNTLDEYQSYKQFKELFR